LTHFTLKVLIDLFGNLWNCRSIIMHLECIYSRLSRTVRCPGVSTLTSANTLPIQMFSCTPRGNTLVLELCPSLLWRDGFNTGAYTYITLP
jgi:hypothetical protein